MVDTWSVVARSKFRVKLISMFVEVDINYPNYHNLKLMLLLDTVAIVAVRVETSLIIDTLKYSWCLSARWEEAAMMHYTL